MRPRPLIGLAALSVLLATPSAAQAQRHGTSPDVLATDSFACATTCTVAQERLSNLDFDDLPLSGAARGVIVGWRLHGHGGQARLRVVGAGGATAWSPLSAAPGPQELPTQLAVGDGDLVGVDLRDGAAMSFVPAFVPGDADVMRRWQPALPDGATAPAGTRVDGYATYQFDVEPDRDGDGLGDDTQDPDGGVPAAPRDPAGESPRGPAPRTPGTPRGEEPRGGGGAPPDPYAALPRSGPRVPVAARASATRKGVVTIALVNPYAFKLDGRLTLRQGKRTTASAKVALAAGGTRTLRLRLGRPAARALARRRKLRLTAVLTLRAPVGKASTASRTIAVSVGGAPRRSAPRRGTPRAPGTPGGDGPAGGNPFDGTFRASDGQTMVVEGGVVQSFSGDLTLYCTRSERQKRVFYSMEGDDPKPTVSSDGRFTWEATSGYGVQKLKFDGTIRGDSAGGRLMVEDRSPLLGTGRIEFDYCFAGKEWTLTR